MLGLLMYVFVLEGAQYLGQWSLIRQSRIDWPASGDVVAAANQGGRRHSWYALGSDAE